MNRKNWTQCDGDGHLDNHPECEISSPEVEPSLYVSRRKILSQVALSTLGFLTARSALAQVAINPSGHSQHVLVSIFLRGGADGLSIVTPYGEDAYYRVRPNLSIPDPKAKVAEGARLLDLDGFFGMHPKMRPLLPYVESGELRFVHAVGSNDGTRSHFEAMRTMEYGMASGTDHAVGGWLARYLMNSEGSGSPLRSIALGNVLPDSLRGATDAVTIAGLSTFQLRVPESAGTADEWLADLDHAYSVGRDELTEAGQGTLKLLNNLRRSKTSPREERQKLSYPSSDLGNGLRDVATLIRSDVGLEVASLDRGAWDTHITQGTLDGWLAGNISDVAQAIAAFAEDLGPLRKNVTVVVQTEFGRRVEENVTLGTDHGMSSVMMVLGPALKGPIVHTQWPGLERDKLDPVGDLRVTTDYRSVLAEVLQSRMKTCDLAKVFPGWVPSKVGLA